MAKRFANGEDLITGLQARNEYGIGTNVLYRAALLGEIVAVLRPAQAPLFTRASVASYAATRRPGAPRGAHMTPKS